MSRNHFALWPGDAASIHDYPVPSQQTPGFAIPKDAEKQEGVLDHRARRAGHSHQQLHPECLAALQGWRIAELVLRRPETIVRQPGRNQSEWPLVQVLDPPADPPAAGRPVRPACNRLDRQARLGGSS